MLEEKIKSIQFSKNDELLEKYNLELITEFVKTKLTNLPKMFEDSLKSEPEIKLKQVQTLLCSIFPLGMPYGKNGYSNTEISPFFRAILDLQPKNHDLISFGGEGGIRTHDTLANKPPFQGGAIVH